MTDDKIKFEGMHFVPVEGVELEIKGTPLKTQVRRIPEGVCMGSSGEWPDMKAYNQRLRNPEKGDFTLCLAAGLVITVFDGKKKVTKAIDIAEIPEDDIEKLCVGFSDLVYDLLYKHAVGGSTEAFTKPENLS